MADMQQVFLKIVEFSKKEFPEEIRMAREEYKKKIQPPASAGADDADIEYDFISWFTLLRNIKGSGLRPIDVYYYKYLDEMPDDEFEAVERLVNCRYGIYEVIERRGKKYDIKDLYTGEIFRVKEKDLDKPMKEGTIIESILVEKSSRNYMLHGGILEYAPEVKEEITKEINKKEKFTNLQMKKFIEHFHCYDPEFGSMKEAFEANMKFMEWFNQQSAKELGTEPPKTIFQVPEVEEEFERVGLVCTEAGICTVPNYGYIKDIISGHYKKVLEWEDILYTVIEDEEFVPSGILKKLMLDNKDSCVKAFSKAYDDIRNFDDVLELVRDYREDFDRKELPRVVSAENAGKPSEEPSKEKFSLKMECGKCGKEFECCEERLVEGAHFCEGCFKHINEEIGKVEGFFDKNMEDAKGNPEKFLEKMTIFAKDTFCNGSWEEFKKAMKGRGFPDKAANENLIRIAESLEKEERGNVGKG